MLKSAVPLRTKRNALTQEVKRRLRNCHQDVPKEEVAEILSKFAQKLKNSGYNHRFRQQVIDAGVKAHKQDVEKDRQGEKKLYRSRSERLSLNKSRRGRTKWWKNVREDVDIFAMNVRVSVHQKLRLNCSMVRTGLLLRLDFF